ncbi:metabotropic glutamate receptor 6-like [Panulirus ornatus]|uniref:metabotropic glutamate receptor 6-like n=1 Tax=Panulirus ornatus TaxID=150431 RepID=UPI003A89A89B
MRSLDPKSCPVPSVLTITFLLLLDLAIPSPSLQHALDLEYDLRTLLYEGRYLPRRRHSELQVVTLRRPKRLAQGHPIDLNFTWPTKKVVATEGHIMLGGLMMVHERHNDIVCGPIMPQGGVQALEAMLYTLDFINDEVDFIPGVTLGAHILDDCDKDTYGLEQAVDFIKGSISNIDDGEYKCRDGSSPEVRNKVISGVVGAASSVTSIQVANLLRLFRIPQVSFFSTSPELSNKQRFEYFSRTIPSDHYQVKAMVQIVQKLGWSYISIIYEESNYGIKAFEELEGLLVANHICIAVKEKLVKDSGVAEEVAYDLIVQRLLQKQRARGVIIFGSDQEVAGVMRAVRRNNATASFSWIGSDGWSARSLVSSGNEPEVEGTLSVQPQANPVRGFDDYFLSLTVEKNKRNPWFVEYWEDHFKCRYPGSARTPYNGNYTTTCTGQEKLTKHNTQFEAQLQFVSDAVMAFGYAFRDMHRDLCGGQSGLCPKMTPIDGEQLLSYLRKVNFLGLSDDSFRFDQQGDGPARYNIIHFKQTSPARYDWVTVGQYVQGELKLNMTALQFKLGQPWPPSSVCSLPCLTGQAKKYVEGESCCWHCFNCSTYQVRPGTASTVPPTRSDPALLQLFHLPGQSRHCFMCSTYQVSPGTASCVPPTRSVPALLHVFHLPGQSRHCFNCSTLPGQTRHCFNCSTYQIVNPRDETQCLTCDWGTLPSLDQLKCNPIAEVYIRPDSWWAIGAMLFSSVGVVMTSVVMWVFLRHNDTPVVRASGRELSYVLLSGVLLCYAMTFVLVLKGTEKTLDPGKVALPQRQTGPALQNSTGKRKVFFLFTAGAKSIFPLTVKFTGGMITDTYALLGLIVVCTVYAVLTRKIPEAFNESKHIGFTMYTTCIIWLAFVPIYFSTANNVELRITTISVTISLSATVALVCLFTPKLYILLLHPERNVRQSMMSTCKHSTIRNTLSYPCQRVDSGTQSEVIFPLDYELHEKLRTRGSSSHAALSHSASQTCPASCVLPDHDCGVVRTLLPTPVASATNGPVQDVPDVQL